MKRNHLRSRSTSQHQMRLKNTLIALCESRSKPVLKQKGCRSRPGARNYDMRIGKIARRRRTHPRLEGKTPIGMAHGHPPHSTNPPTPGSSILEQALIDPKTLVHACQACRPALDEGAGADIDPWQDLGCCLDSLFFFLFSPCVARFPLLRWDSSLFEGNSWWLSHNATLHAARLKLPNHAAEGSDDAGVVCWKLMPPTRVWSRNRRR